MTYQILRTNTRTGAQIAGLADTEKDARAHIFWCAYDNVGLSRRDASKAADAATIGEPYALGDYLFRIERAA